MQGILALDIDGTLIHGVEEIPLPVVRYLEHLNRMGWCVMFLTGRTFAFAHHLLKDFPFPYILSVQNGAVTLEMPERKILDRRYLDRSILPDVEALFKEEGTGPVVYGGFEAGDLCYFRPDLLPPEMNAYLKRRQGPFLEVWKDLADFNELPISTFPSLKCFGPEHLALRISEKLKRFMHIEVSVIRDPFDENYFLAQATHQEANKGKALHSYLQNSATQIPIIAAGDDYNDISMLRIATTKIVMQGAPNVLLDMADIVAPASKARGIIPALKRAVHLYD